MLCLRQDLLFFFFFNDTATTEIYTLSLHDALPICLVGHAGDGNFHLIYVLDPDNAAELEYARVLNDRMVVRALSMGGTCTGEHGVGLGKMKYLEAEHGAALETMRTLKRALDPDNRMNPGKMVLP